MRVQMRRPYQPPSAATGQAAQKLRSACDHCHAAKIRCSGGTSPCSKCQKDNRPCRYSVRASLGKPKGSLNKKTIEKLRSLIESAEASGEEARYAQNIIARSVDGKGTMNRSSSRSSLAPEPSIASSSSAPTQSTSTKAPEHPGQDRNSCLDDLQLSRNPGGASPIQQRYDPAELELDWEANEANAGISEHRSPPSPFALLDAPSIQCDLAFELLHMQTTGPNQDVDPSPLDRLNAFNSLAATCVRLPPTPASSYGFSFGNSTEPPPFDVSVRPNSTAIVAPPVEPCACPPSLAHCMSELRATERIETPLRLETNLSRCSEVLSVVSSALQCTLCSSDVQILLLASMVMTTIAQWEKLLVQPQADSAPLKVKYGEYGEHSVSNEDSCIVQGIVTGRILANTKSIIGMITVRLDALGTRCSQSEYVKSQVDMLLSSLKSTTMKFNVLGV